MLSESFLIRMSPNVPRRAIWKSQHLRDCLLHSIYELVSHIFLPNIIFNKLATYGLGAILLKSIWERYLAEMFH